MLPEDNICMSWRPLVKSHDTLTERETEREDQDQTSGTQSMEYVNKSNQLTKQLTCNTGTLRSALTLPHRLAS